MSSNRRLVFRIHALKRMFQWRISHADVQHVLATGEIIEDYPNDSPYPSRLVLGWCGTRPVHVVVADNSADSETIVVTVYDPDIRKWEPDFKRRRQ